MEFENTDIAREPLYPEGIAPELIAYTYIHTYIHTYSKHTHRQFPSGVWKHAGHHIPNSSRGTETRYALLAQETGVRPPPPPSRQSRCRLARVCTLLRQRVGLSNMDPGRKDLPHTGNMQGHWILHPPTCMRERMFKHGGCTRGRIASHSIHSERMFSLVA